MDDGCLTPKSKDRRSWFESNLLHIFTNFEGYGEAFGDFLPRQGE